VRSLEAERHPATPRQNAAPHAAHPGEIFSLMVERTFHAPSALDLRQRSILGFVRAMGVATRAQIGEATNMSPSMVIRLVGDLIDLGLLVSDDGRPDARRPGRPSELLRLDGRAGFGIGIEFGRDTFTTVVTDAVGTWIASDRVHEVPPFVADEAAAERLAAAVRGAAARAGIGLGRVEAVGVALHDIVDAQGAWVVKGRRAAPFPVRARLEADLGISTTVEDVSRAFAEAEFRFGAGTDVLDMVYVFIGRYGVGSGIFVNGQLLRSSSGVCGEIGHVIVDEGGRLCVCGSLGCLETVALHEAVIDRYKALLVHGVDGPDPAAAPLTFGDVCAAAGAGEKAAMIVLDHLAHAVGVALASLVNLSGAPHIVIGGDLVQAGDMFLHEVAGTVRRRVISALASELTVRYALLPAHAGAHGAALQALQAAWASGRILERAARRRMG
jgi:N-acetylglucosamine repressor